MVWCGGGGGGGGVCFAQRCCAALITCRHADVGGHSDVSVGLVGGLWYKGIILLGICHHLVFPHQFISFFSFSRGLLLRQQPI